MLAFTTLVVSFSCTMRFSIKATQPVPRGSPYSADRLSPNTSNFAALAGTAQLDLLTASRPSKVKCFQHWRRRWRKRLSMLMQEPIIAVNGISKQVTDSTGTLTILHDINFTLLPRESVAIVGASGSGKSTLLSIIAGLDVPTTGTVTLAGTALFTMDEDARAEVRARSVGFVFQSFQLLANLTALENVMLPLELMGHNDARAQAMQMLQRVGLGERLGHYPKVLSGGEQQRVALARAFVVRPAVLLADEPTGSLDFATGETVMRLMFDMNREAGTTLVLVTHDPAIAARCDRQLRIEAGGLVS